ncbi:hypothetical protein B7463_g10687, partial [Scytalidium lignicola]
MDTRGVRDTTADHSAVICEAQNPMVALRWPVNPLLGDVTPYGDRAMLAAAINGITAASTRRHHYIGNTVILKMDIDPRLQPGTAQPSSVYIYSQTGVTRTAPGTADATLQSQSRNFDVSPNQNLQASPDTEPVEQAADNRAAEDEAEGGEGGLNDPKRPRACEACRGLKVRCEPDQNNADGPCRRCAKANRNCVVTVPSRKRQKKTDSRVAELEKKIDALTASLQASRSGGVIHDVGSESQGHDTTPLPGRQQPYEQVTNGGYGSPYSSRPEARMTPPEWTSYPKAGEFDGKKIPPPMVMAGQKRKHSERESSTTSDTRLPASAATPKRPVDIPFAQHGPIQQFGLGSATANPRPTHEYADVIDRGVVTAETATRMFNCYVEKMAPHLPAVVFPPGTTAADVRKSNPTLFLAILSASSGTCYPELSKMLTKEVMSVFAARIMCNGEKTLELVQALQICTLWYWPPEHFEELKFYQLIHIAAVMAIDIGLGRKSKPRKSGVKPVGLWREHQWRRSPFPDAESIEARRAWLGCYFLCCNVSMGLRRPNLIRWTNFMADCIDVLETSPDAAPSDKLLCQWVRSQHIAEDVGTQFSMDDPLANVNISDLKVQYALKGFERDLENWSSHVPLEVMTPSLKMTEHVANLYMHEVALHVDHNIEEFKPPFSEDALRGSMSATSQQELLTPAHISALSVCLTSIDGIFSIFLKLEVDIIRCLPVIIFVRLAYAVVVLIKMYFAAATPNSELGKVINKDDMKVAQYLDGLVDIFRATAADDRSRTAAKFLMVLLMLKTWFHRQKDGKPSLHGDTTNLGTNSSNNVDTSAEPQNNINQTGQIPPIQQRVGQPPSYSPANTPLQLLSEVATSNSECQLKPEGNNQISKEWQQLQTNTSYPSSDFNMNPIGGMTGQVYGMNGTEHIDPSFDMNVEFTMGDGFEQAIGMTLGGGDFGTYYNDLFFGNITDSIGGGGFSVG